MRSWPPFVVFTLVAAASCSKDSSKRDGKATTAAAPAAAGRGAPAMGAHGIHPQDGKEGLEAWIQMSRDACATKDFARGKGIVMSAIPTRADLAEVFTEALPADALDKVVGVYSHLPHKDAEVACLFNAQPERTVVSIYAATVEQLQAYEEGTDASREFPGGAKDLATRWLRPGKTFYEVEVTEPGQPDGTKFHMFFWDGHAWKMLGPVWRALPGSP